MKKHFITLFSLFIISSATYGQRAATKTQKFDSKIENIVLDPATGIVYLKEDSKISAFSNELDKIVWTVDQDQIGANSALKALSNFDITAIGVDKDLLEVVEGSDYIYTVINDRNLVINGLTGDVVFNSERDLGEEIVMQQMFLPCDNAFLFLVRQKKDLKLKYFDLDTKKISWESEAGSQPSGLKATLSKDQALRQDRVESFENDLYALVNNKLLLIDKKSGKLNWVQEDINQFFICQNGANVVVIKNKGGMLSSKQIVNILNSGSGKFLWKKDIETRYVVSLQDWNDRVMIA
ncbi:MAG: PQQ-binding-like beta-propeller repeat protein, partial [Spirosomataceae bacterium]